jgi:6-pyruvoyltetrahydropterin/6-carboxytetrahydropterin synthase
MRKAALAATIELAMPFTIDTTREFSAAHQLRLYDGSLEPVHGHNWRVRVTVAAEAGGLDSIGVVMDFHELERLVDGVVGRWHNRHLNDVEPFAAAGGELRLNPSAENVAQALGQEVRGGLPKGIVLLSVEVWETRANRATYRP